MIGESIESEEAIALQKSVVEYRPSSKVSQDILKVTAELALAMKAMDHSPWLARNDEVDQSRINFQDNSEIVGSNHGFIA